MKLSEAILRPGRVLEVVDKIGTIKCCAPGVFSDKDKPETLPPVIPFFVSNSKKFSMVEKNDDIWLLTFNDNPLQLYYLRKDDISKEFEDITDDETEDLEVLASRDSGLGKARIYFVEKDGWVIQNQDAIIQIREDQSIVLKTPDLHRCIDINSDNISIGSEGESAQKAVLGNNLVDTLFILSNMLDTISQAAGSCPYTLPIQTAIDAVLEKFDKSILKILSGHVTLD